MDPGAVTLPNVRVPYLIRPIAVLKSTRTKLFKHYNPFVIGGSIGYNDFPEVCVGEHALTASHRNNHKLLNHTIRAHLSHETVWVERSRRSAQRRTDRGIRCEFDA